MFGCQIAKVFMIYSSGTGQDHSGSFVMGVNVLNNIITTDRFDVSGGSQNCTSKRGTLVCNSMKVIKYNFLKVHFNLLHFLGLLLFLFQFLVHLIWSFVKCQQGS